MQTYPSPLTVSVMNMPSVAFQSVRIYNGRVYYTIKHTHIKQTGIFSRDIHNTDDIRDELKNTDYSVGTGINVYGGECMCVCPHGIVFADAIGNSLVLVKDNQYKILVGDGVFYYADVVYNAYNDTITYICEHQTTHTQHIARYDFKNATETILAQGADFYHCPTTFRDKTAWLEWDKQHMPWDNSRIVQDGNIISQGCGHFQPYFSHNGDLYYVKDTGDYHHIFCNGQNITGSIDMDFYMPLWIYGMRTFTVVDNIVVAIGVKNGEWHMGTVVQRRFCHIHTPASEILTIHSDGTDGIVGFLAKYSDAPDTVQVAYIPTGDIHTIQTADALPIGEDYISPPRAIQFANGEGDIVHAFYYPPKNPHMPSGITPPLLVKSHGGPTGQTTTSYNPKIQFWTSRGFAVLDVNYSGSTGFGSPYRNRLNGRWGVLDVSDLVDGVQYCIANNLCNPDEICISGSSAGGYAVLCALSAYPDVFTAGCSIYGIGDLHSLVAETHKFESKYLDVLIAPYDTHAHVYDARSPMYHTEKFKSPILVLQGTEDKVVPQNQAEQIYTALRRQNKDSALILYTGEAHGFRTPQAKAHALQAEYEFYQYIFNGDTPTYPINTVTHMAFE